MVPALHHTSSDSLLATHHIVVEPRADFNGHWRDGTNTEGLVLEAWSQGFMVGALVIMACITIAAMRKRVLLHKLILLEQCLALPHGTFCFLSFDGYGWYVSSTATLLYCSYFLHNIVAWIKVKPFFTGDGKFFGRKTCQIAKWTYLGTLILTVPGWIFEVYNNFCFNNNINNLFKFSRPYEPLMRDPWWFFTNVILLHIIRKTYGSGLSQLVSRCPRLGILLAAICFAIIFTILDILASLLGNRLSAVNGINPYWKLNLVFKCLTDAIMLDDFKTELDRLSAARYVRDNIQRRDISAPNMIMSPIPPSIGTDHPVTSRDRNGSGKRESANFDYRHFSEVEDTANDVSNSASLPSYLK